MDLFFTYSLDCETPACTPYTQGREREPFFHGPQTWEAGEASVRDFVALMSDQGTAAGTTLNVYPDVARHQASLFREMVDTGVEVGLHLNTLRYSRIGDDKAKWLGHMDYDEQHYAIAMAKDDLEQTLGWSCRGFRSCYGSTNDHTFGVCEDLGFEWTSHPHSRFRPEFASCWRGSWPYPHHTNRKSKLVYGEMKLFEMPGTNGLTVMYDSNPNQPLNLRAETPAEKLGPDRQLLRDVIEENIVEMEKRAIPVRTIIAGSHNTPPFGQRDSHQARNVVWVIRHTREAAASHGLTFRPAHFEDILDEANRVDSY